MNTRAKHMLAFYINHYHSLLFINVVTASSFHNAKKNMPHTHTPQTCVDLMQLSSRYRKITNKPATLSFIETKAWHFLSIAAKYIVIKLIKQQMLIHKLEIFLQNFIILGLAQYSTISWTRMRLYDALNFFVMANLDFWIIILFVVNHYQV